MSKVLEKLEQLEQAVPESPGFADSVTRLVRNMPRPATRRTRHGPSRRWLAVAAMAALIVVGGALMFALSEITLSPQQAFGQMLKRLEQLDSVQYCVSDTTPAGHSEPERRIEAAGLHRSEFPHSVFVHNKQASPDCDLWIYPDQKRAEFELVDKEREASADGNPVVFLKKFMMTGVTTAPDETYQGKAARVFVSAQPESIDGGRQTRTRRVLVDKSTDLPLRIEIEIKITGQGTFRDVKDQFDWRPTINESTFSTVVPAGFAVTYNLIRPLDRALGVYDSLFRRLPEKCDEDALTAFTKKLQEQSAADGKPVNKGHLFDAEWGFSVPAFAAKHQIDFRYYGAGKTLGIVPDQTRERIAAIETAPGSGKYDVLMSDFSRDRVDRSQLP
jgi:hypothetical protein